MTPATPKPHAGEHTKGHTILERARIAEQDSAEETLGKSLGQTVNAHHSAMKAVEAERDLLRERERELVEALEKIASCHSAFDGDVVSIAYKALAKIQLKKLKDAL